MAGQPPRVIGEKLRIFVVVFKSPNFSEGKIRKYICTTGDCLTSALALSSKLAMTYSWAAANPKAPTDLERQVCHLGAGVATPEVEDWYCQAMSLISWFRSPA